MPAPFSLAPGFDPELEAVRTYGSQLGVGNQITHSPLPTPMPIGGFTNEAAQPAGVAGVPAQTGTEAQPVPDAGGVRGGEGGLSSPYQSTVDAPPLEGLPTKLTVPNVKSIAPNLSREVAVGPNRTARQAAADYMATVPWDYNPPTDYAKVNEPFATMVAQAYHNMPHAPDDPAVKASYDAMKQETLNQWKFIEPNLKIDWITPETGDPYAASPRLAHVDVNENNHLWVYPTDSGFGSNENFDPSQNPLLEPTGLNIAGKDTNYNDLFRIVHDYFGHIKEGNGFRAGGEENAYRSHSAMYSPLARPAMASETRGQNSWVNFGPNGDANRTASAADTVYADQKTGLMPSWAIGDPPTAPDVTGNTPPDVSGNAAPPQAPLSMAAAARKSGINLGIARGNNAQRTYAQQLFDSGMDPESIAIRLAQKFNSKPTQTDPDYAPPGFTPAGDPKQQSQADMAAPTVLSPRQIQYPGIYSDPRQIAAAAMAKFAPESPALYDQFGVTRQDLGAIGQYGTRQGNMNPAYAGMDANGRDDDWKLGSLISNPQNAQRLVDTLGEMNRYPQFNLGADNWYVMDPAFWRLRQLVGPEEAIKQYNQLNHFSGMTSMMSPVNWEMNRGLAARYLANQGRFDEFPMWGSMKTSQRPYDFPSDLADMIPHMNTKAASAAMRNYMMGYPIHEAMDSVKVPLYVQASGVPETGFQTTLPVPDAHFAKSIGTPDVKSAVKTRNVSLKSNIFNTVGPWFRNQVAAPLGLQAVPAQARMWNMFGPITGVDTMLGVPKLELLARGIRAKAQRLGINENDLRDRVLLGQDYPDFEY